MIPGSMSSTTSGTKLSEFGIFFDCDSFDLEERVDKIPREIAEVDDFFIDKPASKGCEGEATLVVISHYWSAESLSYDSDGATFLDMDGYELDEVKTAEKIKKFFPKDWNVSVLHRKNSYLDL